MTSKISAAKEMCDLIEHYKEQGNYNIVNSLQNSLKFSLDEEEGPIAEIEYYNAGDNQCTVYIGEYNKRKIELSENEAYELGQFLINRCEAFQYV